ncbi:MAG: hypothetical protein J6Y80_01055, partial [Victivallales bacterium]|nr:hypothetical protein [Victivallales bacterium]
MTVGTGLSEKEFAERLENMIVRFSRMGADQAELDVVRQYRELKSHAERQAFLNALPNDPKFGLKARALAIRCLYSCKVTDYATLSIVNGISANDALSLARILLALPPDTTSGQVRETPQILDLLHKVPVEVEDNEQAYIPATSNTQYNKFVHESLVNTPEKLLPAHRNLATSVKDQVRTRLGEVAMPGDTKFQDLVMNKELAGINFPNPDDWEAKRNTADNIRTSYLAAALQTGAINIVNAEMAKAINELGGDPEYSLAAMYGINNRHPEFIRTLAAAGTPEQARQIVATYRPEIERQAKLYCKAKPLFNGILERTKQTIAGKLGISPDVLGNKEYGILRKITMFGRELFDKILYGRVQANTDEEIEAAIKDLVDRTVAGLTDHLGQVDKLEPPLPPHLADLVKMQIFDLQKFKNIDVGHIVQEVQQRVHTENLEHLLRGNGDKGQIQNEMKSILMTINAIASEMLAGEEEIGPDDIDGIKSIAAVLVIYGHKGLADRLDAFFLRPDVRPEFEQAERSEASSSMDYFGKFSFHPGVYRIGPEYQAKIHKLFTEPRQVAAFKAAGGEQAALLAGYHIREIPMLARCFALHKAATGCTDEEAMAAAFDPKSKVRLLFSYGGRFITTPENFSRGLQLMEKFRTWRANQLAAYNQGQRNTPTLLNVRPHVIQNDAERGLEKFVLEEIASNPAHDLAEEDADKLFALENNKAMRFVGLGYGESVYCTLAAVPPSKRGLIFDVVDLLRGPVARTQQEREAQHDITYRAIFIARVLKHYDELEDLRLENHFDRAHVVPLLFGDLGIDANADAGQIDNAIANKLDEVPQEINFTVMNLAGSSGATIPECQTAIEASQLLSNAPYVVVHSPGLSGLGTVETARNALIDDLQRPQNPGQLPANTSILEREQMCFTFRIQGTAPLVSKYASDAENDEAEQVNEAEVHAANNAIADKLAELCGPVHPQQLSSVYFALSQSGAGAMVRSAFMTHDISSTEHMPLTFDITRNNDTGAIEITCSEPAGFPLHFHWTTTVALDGTV